MIAAGRAGAEAAFQQPGRNVDVWFWGVVLRLDVVEAKP